LVPSFSEISSATAGRLQQKEQQANRETVASLSLQNGFTTGLATLHSASAEIAAVVSHPETRSNEAAVCPV